jgi:succinylarginine dihydrolase
MVIQQNPDAIDSGVFHNDVIAVANQDALLYHEEAFVNTEATVDAMEAAFGHHLHRLRIQSADVSVEDAVKSYLFNSQLLTLPDGAMAIIAPQESQENRRVYTALTHLQQANDNPVQQVHYLNLRESMKNGGGPACLRLRVVLTEAELAAMHPGVLYSEALHAKLAAWVERYYRETLAPEDLADPQLLEESFAAQEALLDILQLTPHYKPLALQ